MIITYVLNDFINHWKVYNKKEEHRINSGDCGLAAIAVHYVLLNKYQIETNIIFNFNHCWLKWEGDDYDTSMPEGYHPDTPANFVWSDGPNGLSSQISLQEACNEFMPCDSFGAYLVKAFVEYYGLPMIPELQHCIDKAAEYERPEEVPVLEARYRSLKETIYPKIIRYDGKVAVLIYPYHGTGWFSSPENCYGPRILFSPRLVLAVLKESGEDPYVVAESEFPDVHAIPADRLEVEWVKEGSKFRIDADDGYEKLVLLDPNDYITA